MRRVKQNSRMEGALKLKEEPIPSLNTLSVLESYPCQSCAKVFYILSIRDAHERSVHAQEAKATNSGAEAHKCKQCDYKASSAFLLLFHVKRTHGPHPLFCKLCDYSTNLQSGIIKHMSVAHSGVKVFENTVHRGRKLDQLTVTQAYADVKPLVSSIGTQEELPGKGQLERLTVAQVNVKPLVRSIGTRKMPRKSKLEQRTVSEPSECEFSTPEPKPKAQPVAHYGPPTYKCSTCWKQLSSGFNLTLHRLTHLNYADRDRPFGCSNCGKKLITKQALEYHMIAHSGEKPFECSICSKAFRTERHLKSHIVTHNEDALPKCSICSKRFATKQSLKMHMITHSGEKPFECPFCSKRLTSKHSLKSHMHVAHSSDKPYKCTPCSLQFSSREKLKAHMATHSGDKPFECSTCGKRFRLKCYFMQHMVTHSVDKPFGCSTCGSKFFRKTHLTAHIHATHTKEEDKPYECSTRGKRYGLIPPLKAHMSTHHGGDKVPATSTTEDIKPDLETLSSPTANCPICCQQFSADRPLSLKRHLLEHTGPDSAFLCEICNCGFRSRVTLNRHISNNHTLLGL